MVLKAQLGFRKILILRCLTRQSRRQLGHSVLSPRKALAGTSQYVVLLVVDGSNLIRSPNAKTLGVGCICLYDFLRCLKQPCEGDHVRSIVSRKPLSKSHASFAFHDCRRFFSIRVHHSCFVTPLICILKEPDTQTPTMATPLTTSNASMQTNAVTQTDGVKDPPLFPPSLISPEVSSSLPDGYTMRPLRRSDYHGGMA
jgi:hypothetical protein